MPLHAQIVTLRQDLDLEQEVQVNFLVLRLPSGKLINAMVQDDVVEHIVGLIAGQKNGTSSAMPVTPVMEPSQYQETAADGTPITVFGGDGGSDFVPPPESEEEQAEEAPPPRPAMRQPIVRARQVQMDDRGNPVLALPGGADPGQVIGNEEEPGEASSV